MSVTVYNVEGSGKDKCTCCASWKCHWVNNYEEEWPDECVVVGCGRKPTVGAHVSETKGVSTKCDSNGNVYFEPAVAIFIVPFCDVHNDQEKYDHNTPLKIKARSGVGRGRTNKCNLNPC